MSYKYIHAKPNLDDAAHAVHEYKNPSAIGWTQTECKCRICGNNLKAFYAEERLYIVRCEHCHITSLLEARNPYSACGIIGIDGGEQNAGIE